MSTAVPRHFPLNLRARSGLPPSSVLARVLEDQSLWLWAANKGVQTHWLGAGSLLPLTDTEAPEGSDEEELLVQVPPYTTHLRWGVLALGDDNDAAVYLQRVAVDGSAAAETYRHMLSARGNRDTTEMQEAVAYFSQAEPTDDDLPEHVHVGDAVGRWQEVTLSLGLTNATVFCLWLEPLVLATV